MRYSHSRIRLFEKCPLAFRYQYIDKVKIPTFETIESFMGARVHETLEWFYNERMNGRLAELDDILQRYGGLWKESINDDIVVVDESLTPEHYRMLGGRCLEHYYLKHAPFERGHTIATEMMLNFDLLGDGRYRFLGYVDRLDSLGNGSYEIHDYKTGHNIPSREQNEKDRQLALYEIGIRQNMKDVVEVELVWHYLTHNREIRARKNPDRLEAVRQETLKSIHNIESAIESGDYPPVKGRMCAWCEYQELCKQERPQKQRQSTLRKYAGGKSGRHS